MANGRIGIFSPLQFKKSVLTNLPIYQSTNVPIYQFPNLPTYQSTMKTIALCAQSYLKSVRRAAGVEPITFPPLTIDTFAPSQLENIDLLYLKFHGLPQQPYLYAGRYITAISAEQLAAANLNRTVVFGAVCHLPQTPIIQALFQAGARVVVAGDGVNYGSSSRLYGADLLGYYFRRFLACKLPSDRALALARLIFRLHRPRSPQEKVALEDTLGFRPFTPDSSGLGGINRPVSSRLPDEADNPSS
ncbi:MAG: hypothetical protein JXA42_08320 [Anaerolineales bacterium]|nr:hypothetical protein [Anaerolineales bacterium]